MTSHTLKTVGTPPRWTTLTVSPLPADFWLSPPGFLPCLVLKVPVMRLSVRLHLMYQVWNNGGRGVHGINYNICLPCNRHSSWSEDIYKVVYLLISLASPVHTNQDSQSSGLNNYAHYMTTVYWTPAVFRTYCWLWQNQAKLYFKLYNN